MPIRQNQDSNIYVHMKDYLDSIEPHSLLPTRHIEPTAKCTSREHRDVRALV